MRNTGRSPFIGFIGWLSIKTSVQLEVRGLIKDTQCFGDVGGQNEWCYWRERLRLRRREGYQRGSPATNPDTMSGVLYRTVSMCLQECVYTAGYNEVSTLLNPLLDENTCEPLRPMHHLPDSEDGPTRRPWVAALSCSPPAKCDAQKAIKACAHQALLQEESHPLEKLRYISILIM